MKRTIFCILILSLCLSVCSCGAKSVSMDAESPMYNEKYEYDMAEDGYYESPKGSASTGIPAPGTTANDSSTYAEKIIHSVTLTAETRDFDRALAALRTSVASLGGYEQSVSTTGKSYHSNDRYCRTARMTLRIPAEQLNAFLGSVGDLVNITNQSSTATNVTTEYYDIQSRIGVLQSEKAAYEEMLKKSNDVNYLLQVKDRLYNVIEEIEAYETQLRLYDNKVAYSTVTVTLEEVIEYTQVTTPRDTFGSRIAKAFTESWQDFAEGCQSFTVWLVYALPTLLVLAVIAGCGIALLLLSARRIRNKKHADKQDAQ